MYYLLTSHLLIYVKMSNLSDLFVFHDKYVFQIIAKNWTYKTRCCNGTSQKLMI